jgi:hypothetical protein
VSVSILDQFGLGIQIFLSHLFLISLFLASSVNEATKSLPTCCSAHSRHELIKQRRYIYEIFLLKYPLGNNFGDIKGIGVENRLIPLVGINIRHYIHLRYQIFDVKNFLSSIGSFKYQVIVNVEASTTRGRTALVY